MASGLPRWLPRNDTLPAPGAGGDADTACRLSLTLDRPEGYTEAEGATKGWVNWGPVGNVIPSNIATSFGLVTGRLVWVKATTNGAIPLRVLSAEIEVGASVPDDVGGGPSSPPSTAHYLLGQVGGAGTEGSPFFVLSTGCGGLRLEAVAVGYTCVLADPGDPEAEPPVPSSAGGIATDYELRWSRV